MMTKQITFAALILATLGLATAGSQVLACGYGAFDADVELACSGDPLQVQQAIGRLLVRGEKAIPIVLVYQRRGKRQDSSYRKYLGQLIAGEQEMTAEQRRNSIEQWRSWLAWNEKRLAQLDMLLFLLRGKGFAANAWSWLPIQG